ncbi:hypothetical protein ACJZ2D_005860 [Fusarium nematophilum]
MSSQNAQDSIVIVSNGVTYLYETHSILDRTLGLSKKLKKSTLEVLAVFSGLRPSLEGGTRVKKQVLSMAGQKRTVIHNYGAGRTGFQAGYGMALDAVNVAQDLLSKVERGFRSKL